MQKIVSKHDNKEYYLCTASEAAEYTPFDINGRQISLYGNGKYQVRKSEKEGYVTFNGTIWDEAEAYSSLIEKRPITYLNGYNGTYMFGVEIPVSIAKEIFTYVA